MEAALNNARWCELVCRAHGLSPRRQDGLWLSGGAPPRYYPDAVTLEPGAHDAIARHRPRVFKDSFADVDGAALGYQPMFRASWLRRPPVASAPVLRRVQSEAELLAWERAWDPAEHPRQFPASLLREPEVVFLVDEAGRAGGIAHASDGVVGLGNVFGFEDAPDAWSNFAGAAGACFPDRPLVTYERGPALTSALRAGFEVCGTLVVWMR